MNLIMYMPDFARLPVISVVLLAVAMILPAVPKRGKLLRFCGALAVAAAVTAALLADADKLLLAAALLMSAGGGMALYNRRRAGK